LAHLLANFSSRRETSFFPPNQKTFSGFFPKKNVCNPPVFIVYQYLVKNAPFVSGGLFLKAVQWAKNMPPPL
jgi:hypothetical protein